jgi:DNA-binding NarL/FixJ family response regulator
MIDADTKPSILDPLSAGYAALTRGAWEEARARFAAALKEKETPEALEGFGLAAWWLEQSAATLEARERAYRLYRASDDRRGAARVAVALAEDYLTFRGEPAVAHGWLRRAHRLLEGIELCAEHGWLACLEGYIAFIHHTDSVGALKAGAQAAGIGRSLRLLDLEMVGLALGGLALVSQGQIAEGMSRLDEATATAVSGEVTDPNAIGTACCYLIHACERVRDYSRAAQWCERVKELCRRWRFQSLFAVCRTHYATVLMWRGAWADADRELTTATRELAATRPPMVVEGLVRLGELRRRQGRFEEAATLFAKAETHPLAQLGRAALALDQGDAVGAADLAERFLRRIPAENRTDRVAALELIVRAYMTLGQGDQARAAVSQLHSVAAVVDTEPMWASARLSEGVVAAGVGDHQTARRRLEDAVDLFERSGAPFEAALARIALARSLGELERGAAATQEARTARDSLRALGATKEVERAEALIREFRSAGGADSPMSSAVAGLTRREREVLRLVAEGLSNQKIAAKLVLSEHTVKRHVANILTKLNLPSRAAAAAKAAREGLL